MSAPGLQHQTSLYSTQTTSNQNLAMRMSMSRKTEGLMNLDIRDRSHIIRPWSGRIMQLCDLASERRIFTASHVKKKITQLRDCPDVWTKRNDSNCARKDKRKSIFMVIKQNASYQC